MTPIFLIGYMGSGKSTLGRKLAQEMNVEFLDLDILIEKGLGLKINEIFLKKGESFFRQKERDYLTKYCLDTQSIVATGGGTPCFFDNNNIMNSKGITIYLKVSCHELVRRLQFNQNRPLLFKNKLNLKDFVNNQIIERERHYQKSQYIIESDCISVNQIYDLLKNIL